MTSNEASTESQLAGMSDAASKSSVEADASAATDPTAISHDATSDDDDNDNVNEIDGGKVNTEHTIGDKYVEGKNMSVTAATEVAAEETTVDVGSGLPRDGAADEGSTSRALPAEGQHEVIEDVATPGNGDIAASTTMLDEPNNTERMKPESSTLRQEEEESSKDDAEGSRKGSAEMDDDNADELSKGFAEAAKVSDTEKADSTELQSLEPPDNSQPPEGSLNATTLTVPASPAMTEGSPRMGGIRIGKGPPPTTQASEEKPFDFNRFLDQMRHKSAAPVGEYVRSFIKGFTKKPYRVTDQVKLIFDFLDFISQRMRECEVWSKLSTTEFDNAREAMEKLLMNRLYNYTFSPAVKKEGKWHVQTDDLERDRVLKQRIRLFAWINEKHLDVPEGSHSKGFLDFAIEELLKINHYKAPRDKVICILNCCKVIFGLIRHLSSEENADTFIPILIFVVLRSNPDNLISNVEYISRFRNPERLSSESGYYLSSLMGAVAFIETMDYTSLSNITQADFEANVEAEVEKISAQPESLQASPARGAVIADTEMEKAMEWPRTPTSAGKVSSEKVAVGEGSAEARNTQISAGAAALAEDTKAFFHRTGEAAKLGIGASFVRPMGALGRLFSESLDGPRPSSGAGSSVVSGTVTPENAAGPSVTRTVSSSSIQNSSARSRMWGLFGVDDEGAQRSGQQQQQQQYQQQSQSRPLPPNGQQLLTPRSTSSPAVNLASFSRDMREHDDDEAEPQTPLTEELVQGRFVTLPGGDSDLENDILNAPRAQRRNHNLGNGREGSQRYLHDDGQLSSGMRTPEDDGSDYDVSSPTNRETAGMRNRFSDVGGFLPSFLSEQSITRNRATTAQQRRQQQLDEQDNARQQQQSALDQSAGDDTLNEQETAHMTAQIEQAHLSAGVETLKSIFPSTESSVCRLVLEECSGDVQASIDKLLEMS